MQTTERDVDLEFGRFGIIDEIVIPKVHLDLAFLCHQYCILLAQTACLPDIRTKKTERHVDFALSLTTITRTQTRRWKK